MVLLLTSLFCILLLQKSLKSVFFPKLLHYLHIFIELSRVSGLFEPALYTKFHSQHAFIVLPTQLDVVIVMAHIELSGILHSLVGSFLPVPLSRHYSNVNIEERSRLVLSTTDLAGSPAVILPAFL